MSDNQLFAIENWLRRSDIDVPHGKREQVAKAILFKIQVEHRQGMSEEKSDPK